jgi:hypothetical protein
VRERRRGDYLRGVFYSLVILNICTALNIHEREKRTKRQERITNISLSVGQLVTSTLTFSHMLEKMSYGYFEMEDGSITEKKKFNNNDKGC